MARNFTSFSFFIFAISCLVHLSTQAVEKEISIASSHAEPPTTTATTNSISSTSDGHPPVYTNFWSGDCALEGTPTVNLSSIGKWTVEDEVACEAESSRGRVQWVRSYSYNSTATSNQCEIYQDWESFLRPGMIELGRTGVFYSNYRRTGTCFSHKPIPPPERTWDPGAPIHSKSWLRDCSVEGTSTDEMESYRYFSVPFATGILDCQLYCSSINICYSWAWDTTAEPEERCRRYAASFDPWILTVPRIKPGKTGIFFSDRDPADDILGPNNFCYSDHPITVPVYAKTFVSDCAIEGSPSSSHLNSQIPTPNATDILHCQAGCFAEDNCVSWSWNSTVWNFDANPGVIPPNRCMWYSVWIWWSPGEVVPGKTRTFFSNKYPGDGTKFCYGNMPIPEPVLEVEAFGTSNNTQGAGSIGVISIHKCAPEAAKKQALPNLSSAGNSTSSSTGCDGL